MSRCRRKIVPSAPTGGRFVVPTRPTIDRRRQDCDDVREGLDARVDRTWAPAWGPWSGRSPPSRPSCRAPECAARRSPYPQTSAWAGPACDPNTFHRAARGGDLLEEFDSLDVILRQGRPSRARRAGVRRARRGRDVTAEDIATAGGCADPRGGLRRVLFGPAARHSARHRRAHALTRAAGSPDATICSGVFAVDADRRTSTSRQGANKTCARAGRAPLHRPPSPTHRLCSTTRSASGTLCTSRPRNWPKGRCSGTDAAAPAVGGRVVGLGMVARVRAGRSRAAGCSLLALMGVEVRGRNGRTAVPWSLSSHAGVRGRCEAPDGVRWRPTRGGCSVDVSIPHSRARARVGARRSRAVDRRAAGVRPSGVIMKRTRSRR